jgi:hypothetical protein
MEIEGFHVARYGDGYYWQRCLWQLVVAISGVEGGGNVLGGKAFGRIW